MFFCLIHILTNLASVFYNPHSPRVRPAMFAC